MVAADDKQKRRLREQPISRLFPNMITLAGMCCGLSSLRFAMNERWDFAVGFIIIAAIIDGMDGRVARLLGATSTFGAQLDSLSDFVCFGVVPAMVMYMWILHNIHGIGWAVTLFFAMCAALRLARFNTGLLEEPTFTWQKKFFVGVPSPAGGVICLLPLIISLQTEGNFAIPPAVVACHVLLMGALMISKIPTFAGKQLRVAHDYIMPFMIGGGILVVLLLIEPWLMISLVSVAYICSIYFSFRQYSTYAKEKSLT